jgi:exopolyphosphatase/pppGpp-phosphohydrolase
LDKLLKILCKFYSKPNEAERFVLEASAWLHDIGYMLPEPKKHAIHSHSLIKRFGRKYFYLDKAERTVISWICRSHSHDFPLGDVPPVLNLHGEDVRTQILAAIFSLADACDIHTKRAPEIVFEIIKDELQRKAKESIPHWLANQSINGIFFSEAEEAIYISALNLKYAVKAKRDLQRELDRVLPIVGDSFPLKKVKLYRLPTPL